MTLTFIDADDTASKPLWDAAGLLFIVGDSATTAIGLHIGAVEAHPLSATVLAGAGLLGMILVKVLLLGAFYAAYQRAPDEIDVGIPLGLALLGAAIVGWNAVVIAALA